MVYTVIVPTSFQLDLISFTWQGANERNSNSFPGIVLSLRQGGNVPALPSPKGIWEMVLQREVGIFLVVFFGRQRRRKVVTVGEEFAKGFIIFVNDRL